VDPQEVHIRVTTKMKWTRQLQNSYQISHSYHKKTQQDVVLYVSQFRAQSWFYVMFPLQNLFTNLLTLKIFQVRQEHVANEVQQPQFVEKNAILSFIRRSQQSTNGSAIHTHPQWVQ
jgi:hypothetical protein